MNWGYLGLAGVCLLLVFSVRERYLRPQNADVDAASSANYYGAGAAGLEACTPQCCNNPPYLVPPTKVRVPAYTAQPPLLGTNNKKACK